MVADGCSYKWLFVQVAVRTDGFDVHFFTVFTA